MFSTFTQAIHTYYIIVDNATYNYITANGILSPSRVYVIIAADYVIIILLLVNLFNQQKTYHIIFIICLSFV